MTAPWRLPEERKKAQKFDRLRRSVRSTAASRTSSAFRQSRASFGRHRPKKNRKSIANRGAKEEPADDPPSDRSGLLSAEVKEPDPKEELS